MRDRRVDARAASGAPRFVLETARLRLRPVESADLDYFHAAWKDSQVGRFLFDGEAVARDTVAEHLRLSAQSFAAHGYGLWRLDAKPDGAPLGFCGLRPAPWAADVELLYAIAPVRWRQGLTTEAARAVLAYTRDTLGLARVVAAANPDNPASWRVLEKAGMRHERDGDFRGEPLRFYVTS